jgi:hypothetical protein
MGDWDRAGIRVVKSAEWMGQMALSAGTNEPEGLKPLFLATCGGTTESRALPQPFLAHEA